MSKQATAEWHSEFEYMKEQLRYVMNNLDSLSKRETVAGRIEDVYFMLGEMCEQTEGESK